jgi:hypothetical protein
MATFKIGDWVQITSIPDKKWSRWSNNTKYYNNFVDKIGTIKEIDEDLDISGQTLYRVVVDFPHEIEDGYSILVPGRYMEWFKADHLLKSSKYESERKLFLSNASKELQEWEKFKRKTTDDMLRHVFEPEKRPEKEQNDIPNDDPFDPWNIRTNPGGNKSNNSDDYENYYLDYLNPNDPRIFDDD